MSNRPRRPGDQAPPPRAAHRNEHIRTATTHVKDTAGKLYFVHDGSPEKNILHTPDGREMSMLSYEDAKKAKDIAVTRLKQRKASIAEMEATPEMEMNEREQFEAANPMMTDSFVPAAAALPDPQLEANRQKAVAAARPVAQAAQAKSDQVQRAPGWEPAPKNKAPATGKAPGWEPPPANVSGAKQASTVKTGKAAGWEVPSAGKTAEASDTRPAVNLDDPDQGDDEGDGSADLSDLMIQEDLESDVKKQTELAHTAAKALWEAAPLEKQAQLKQQILRVAAEGEREKLYANLDEGQIEEFETFESAYHLLFGLPPTPPAKPQAEASSS